MVLTIGAPYEFDRGNKTKDFPLFGKDSQFTDDTVMTIAVAEAMMGTLGQSDDAVKAALIASMRNWGRKHPGAGYGGRFRRWLASKDPKPYNSFGNGSAMRVSAAGWLFDTLEETRRMARLTAEVTHNHPEGIKGAEAAASAIFLARTGSFKDEIRDYIVREFGYDLSQTCDEIRPGYHHVESCQETVPEAVTAFLEGESFEDVIRTAVSLGGDCDTLTCIAGSMAEAYYGVPDEYIAECRSRLAEDMMEIVDRFQDTRIPEFDFPDSSLEGNHIIEAAIDRYCDQEDGESLAAVLDAIRTRMEENGHLLFPVEPYPNGNAFALRKVDDDEGRMWMAAFTCLEEYEKGEKTRVLSFSIDQMLKACLDLNCNGFIINPWDQPFILMRDLIQQLVDAG